MALPMLIPNGVALAAVPGLTAAQIKTLSDSWITTAQELVAVAEGHASVRATMARVLGVNTAGMDGIIQAARQAIPSARAPGIGLPPEVVVAEYGRGAILEEPPEEMERRAQLPPYAPPGVRAILPESVSHLNQLPSVRNQGGRGTCVAHAVLAVREHLEIAAGSPDDINLSEQFVYWWCKQHDGIPTAPGTYLSTGMRCLQEVGAPLETLWPYVSTQTNNEGQGPPPPAAANGDAAFHTLRTIEFNRADITGIKTCLYQGHVVAFAIPVFESWYYSASTQRWGKITLPLSGELSDGGHAIALVGYQDDPDAPGGGYFLVRNSWQPWAMEAVWQPGYGYLPYGYITRYAQGVFSAERVTEADVFIRDDASDRGVRPLGQPTWNSPDIWLRRSPDGGNDCQAPLAGQANGLYVRVSNDGPAYAYGVQLELFAAALTPCVQTNDWQKIGEATVTRAPSLDAASASEAVCAPVAWTPAATDQTIALQGVALQARLSGADEPAWNPVADKKIGQRNLGFLSLAPGQAGEIAFTLSSGPENLGGITFQLERGDLPEEAQFGPAGLAPAAAGREDGGAAPAASGFLDDVVKGAITGAIMLLAGEQRRVNVPITLPATAQPGARYTVAIVQLQDGDTRGRLNVQVEVVPAA